jgi:hypothetical protein
VRRTAEQSDQGNALRPRQRVPGGRVETRQGHAHHALGAQQPELALQFAVEIEGSHRVALDQRHQVGQQLCHRLQRKRGVAKEVGRSRHALLGQEVNQCQGRHAEGAAAGLQRQAHGNVNRANAQVANREPGM